MINLLQLGLAFWKPQQENRLKGMIVNNICVLKEVWLGLALNKLMRRKFGKWSFNLSVHVIFIDLSFYYGTYFLNSINTPNLPSWQAMFLSLALRWKQNPQTKIHVHVLASLRMVTYSGGSNHFFFNFLNNGDISSFLHVECHFPSQIAQIIRLRILIHV